MTDATYSNVTIVGGGAVQSAGVPQPSVGPTLIGGTGPATQSWPDPIPVVPGGDGRTGYLFGAVNPNQLSNVTVVAGAPSVTLFPVASTSAPGVTNQALIAKGAAVELARQASLPDAIQFAGVALTPFAASGEVQLLTQGPLVGFSLGAGTVGAVGTSADGSLVRASDAACVSRLMYVGFCDATGAVYVQPFTRSEFVVSDYGADPSGVTLSDAAFTAVLRIATEGDSILIPQGTFRYVNTIGPLPIGVTLRGVGSEVVVAGTTYLGSVLQYEGVGDAIRVCSTVNANIAGNWLLESFLVRCVNINNQAPQRQSPSRTLSGTITSIVAAPGGACRVTMSVATGLVDGNLVCLDSVTGTVEANGGWSVAISGANAFDLVGSTFAHAYTGGGNVRMRCGAGVCNIGGGEAVYRNVYATGFGVGFMLDGAETITLDACQADGYEGNSGLGSNVTRFSCAVWLTDGDSGCSGWTVAGSTNVISFARCYFNGARTSFQIDGTAQCNVVSCQNPNVRQAGLNNTPITALTNSGGHIRVTAVGNGVVDGEYVGIAGVTGTIAANANAEWQVQRIDADNFILVGSTFAGAYVSGGVVEAWAPTCFARINRAEQLKFDSCYTEASQCDAAFIFARQTGSTSAQTSQGVTIQNHFAAGAFAPIYVASNAVDGAAAAVSVQNLTLLDNGWFASLQSRGGGQVTGTYTQLGDNYINATPGALFWDTAIAASNGIVSYHNSNGNHYVNAIGGLEGSAQLFIFVQDNATSIFQVGNAAPAKFLDFAVQNNGSTSFSRYVNSPGAGDKAGVSDQLRSALLLQNAGSTVIGTSDVVPPLSNTLCEIRVVAHRDDDVAAQGAYYVYRAFLGQSLAGSLALIGAATKLDSVVGAGFPAALTIAAVGSTITVAAVGNTAADSTWQVSFTIENAQRAR